MHGAHDRRLRGVVFDWAGTIIDQGCLGPAQVFVDAFAEEGIEITLKESRGPMGLRKIDHVAELLKLPGVREQWRAKGGEPGEHDLHRIYDRTEPLMITAAREHATVIPGALETIGALREKGIACGSSTGYTSPIMAVVLPEAKQQGLELDAVVDSSQVPAGRPAPFMCYANALQLGVFPLHNMIKIGDTIADIGEGQNAGMWTIALTASGNEVGMGGVQWDALADDQQRAILAPIQKRWEDAGADYVIESVADALPVIDEIDQRIRAGELPSVLNRQQPIES